MKRISPSTETGNKTVIIFPRDALNPDTITLLAQNGYLGIETDDPRAVVTVLPIAGMVANLNGDQIVQAMIETLLSNESRCKEFGAAMLKLLAATKGNVT